MSSTKDLLVEIGTEELPPKALRRLSDAFTDGLRERLAAAELDHGEVRPYATPRRLAVLVRDVAERQEDKAVERRGPALTAAFDEEGNPTKAAEGFARSCGVDVATLETMETDKGAWLVHRATQAGRATVELLPEMVRVTLDGLPIPKRMRWGDRTVQFVRPVHWAVLLFGKDVVETEILGARTGRQTRGHRFHHPGPLDVGEPAAYGALLEGEGRVLADFDARRETIRAQVLEAAAKAEGYAVVDEALLDEVTGLVEWPVAVVGAFDPSFLELPPEVLVSAMQGHQKYFHLVEEHGALLPRFITVSNIESHDLEQVRAGNERVLRPRLADADFFWRQDRSARLEERVESLRDVVFEKRLGSLYDKTGRVERLAARLAGQIGADGALAGRAAHLSKCDLMTEMVGEFPELQGVMGRYYARHDGEHEEVGLALDEQYRPRFAGDALPSGPVAQAVALADRLDTLVGIFGIGDPPSGDKDPYALRRAALGVLRIVVEKGLEVDLAEWIGEAEQAYRDSGVELAGEAAGEVLEFTMERLRAYYHDRRVAPDTFDAVLARRPTRPLDFDRRVRAVESFRELPEAEALAAANKRIHNILRKAGDEVPEAYDREALVEPQERALAERVEALAGEVEPLLAEGAYEAGLRTLAGLREAVDGFFDEVMVMAEDDTVRRNRLGLLRRLSDLFLATADLSRLQG